MFPKTKENARGKKQVKHVPHLALAADFSTKASKAAPFLISVSETLLLPYSNATDFSMLILYLATLLNLFGSNHLFDEDFCLQYIMLCAGTI